MDSIRSSICDDNCRPPITAAPVQIACPRMPPRQTPITSVEAASPIVAICSKVLTSSMPLHSPQLPFRHPVCEHHIPNFQPAVVQQIHLPTYTAMQTLSRPNHAQ